MTSTGGEPPISGVNGDSGVEQFREELRAWLAANLTPEVVAAGRRPPDAESLVVLQRWNARLADAGWAAPSWPVAFGGRDANVAEQIVYMEELHRVDAPGPVNIIGVSNIAPAIMQFGTEEQQARFLAPMLRGDVIWSQGMSEPDAGSDLASLKMSAVEDGDHFIVNGQKTWNSLGHFADWCQLYVRTDPTAKKHKGISCLLVDLRSPGVEARPLRASTGEIAFAELFMTDLRVPREALLGELNGGWTVAMTTLSHERAGVARLHLALSRKLSDLLSSPQARAALTGDPRLRQRCAHIHSAISCMRWMTERALANPGLHGGAGGSLSKLSWSKCDQELGSLAIDVLGMDGLSGRWADNLVAVRQSSIAGGTTEVNRSIIGEHILGLPREPR